MKQFGVILGVTCIGEMIKFFVPLPVPGSIYGLVLMFVLLMLRVIKLEQVKEAGAFLIEIMPLMFISAGAGLLNSWEQLRGIFVPVLIITVVTTFIVMFVTGKVTDILLKIKGGEENGSDDSRISGSGCSH